jgi:hypothetical protein
MNTIHENKPIRRAWRLRHPSNYDRTFRLGTLLCLALTACDWGGSTLNKEYESRKTRSTSSSPNGGVPEALKTRCALEVDGNAYAFFDGNSVDTRRWRQTTNDRINMAYIRCLNQNRR